MSFPLRVAVPISQPSVAVGSLSIDRISALFEHVNEHIVRPSSLVIPSGSHVDRTSVMGGLTSLLRQMAEDGKTEQDRPESNRELRRQDDERLRTQMLEEMDRRTAAASWAGSGVTCTRVGTATSAGEVRGVSSSGSLPALGEAVGLPRSGTSSSTDSHKDEVGSREFGGQKQSVPKFSGKLMIFSYGSSTSRCLLQ